MDLDASAIVAVERLMKQAAVALVPLAALETREAMSAYARFGKGRGHPARLNPGDCFSYVCARPNDIPPLFVVKNLSQTDIASALP